MIEMKNSASQNLSQSRGRNIALGAAFGLLIGGGLDLILGDTGWGLVIGILLCALVGYWIGILIKTLTFGRIYLVDLLEDRSWIGIRAFVNEDQWLAIDV